MGRLGYGVLVIAIAGWILTVGAGGALLTRLDSWYYSLSFPSWKPPDWLFGPAWTAIFLAAGFAWWLAWEPAAGQASLRAAIVAAFLLNAALNLFWSYLFFWRRRPDWALLEVPFLAGSIVLMIWTTSLARPLAGSFVVPYLLWVLFASVLNRAVVRRNQPFR